MGCPVVEAGGTCGGESCCSSAVEDVVTSTTSSALHERPSRVVSISQHKESRFRESSMESEEDDDDDSHCRCLAIVSEDGSRLVVLDASGKPRSFSQRGVDLRTLCFQTHGLLHVDDLLTPCFDEDGHHGDPEETCFCGLETPHIHAHVRDSRTCYDESPCCRTSKKSNRYFSSEERMRMLATHILYPTDSGSVNDDEELMDIPVTKSMPAECNSHNGLVLRNPHQNSQPPKWSVMHGNDHTDRLVHSRRRNELRLQHDDCEDCGSSCIHGTFTFRGQRSWETPAGGSLSLHFFSTPHKAFDFREHFGEEAKEEIVLETEKTAASTTATTTLRCNAMCCSSECPLITMCLEEEAGIQKIEFDVPQKLVLVEHDASLISAERIETILNDDDFDASILLNNTPENIVTSKFHCNNICCSAECPLVTMCLEDKKGIQDIDFDIPEKLVFVKHDPMLVTAEEILELLISDDFEASLVDDSKTKSNPSKGILLIEEEQSSQLDKASEVEKPIVEPISKTVLNAGTVRSTFQCDGICCSVESRQIKNIVEALSGVTSVAINVMNKLVYVEHDASTVTAREIAECLTSQSFPSEIRIDGKAQQAKARKESVFCLSSFRLEFSPLEEEGLDDMKEEIVKFLESAFDKSQVDSCAFDLSTRTIHISHNPYAVTANELGQRLSQRSSTRAKLILDGKAALHIDYEGLASQSTQREDAVMTSQKQAGRFPKPTVVISGILWIISMISLAGGKTENLKYVGLGSVVFGLPPIAIKAFKAMRRLSMDTNALMFFASIGALALGEITEAAAVVFLFALSEWLEFRATSRARQTLEAIVNLRPDKARLLNPDTNELFEVAASVVPIGGICAVKTGDKIPCDGIVVEGNSTVDESSLTGESRPISKGRNDTVSGGTVNSGVSQLLVRATASAENSAVARLIRLVEEAQVNRSETEKMVDEFARWYTPAVLVAALAMCTIPWAFGKDKGRQWTENGLVLIVVACPCALIISTPVSYVAGLAATASKGVLIRGGAFLESLGRVKRICFDKTGTLTSGEFAIIHFKSFPTASFSERAILEYLSLMEERASHPVATAILTRAKNEGIRIPYDLDLKKHRILAGEGVVGVINGREVHVGNERLFERLGELSTVSNEIQNDVRSWKSLGGTIGFMSIEGQGIVCAFCAADAVRPESRDVIRRLKKKGISLIMLTGDNEDAAHAVGQQIGLADTEIQAKLLPEEKLERVKSISIENLEENSRCVKKGRQLVLFCGDGVNDAPALAVADVGVAMGAGAALAMETADVTLLDSNLLKLEMILEMGRRVIGKIWQNVAFSIAVKLVVLCFALVGKTHLWAAIASDVGAMIVVTLNSMTLLPRTSRQATSSAKKGASSV